MFDLTLLKEDKEFYIVDVFLNDDGTYTVKYADGKIEVYPFSIHNFQVELHRMEEQFSKYGQDYLERAYPNGGIRAGLLAMLFVVDAVAFKTMLEEGFTFTGVWCLAYGMYVILSRGIPQLKQRKLFVEGKKKIGIMKYYLEHKDGFKVNVVDPSNGKDAEWYLVDLASIDNFVEEAELSEYLDGLTPEVKREKAEEISLKLRHCVEGE